MGQTTSIFPWAQRTYHRFIKSSLVDRVVKKIVNGSVNILATIMGWSFPEKFNWSWKLEMLLQKYEQETVAVFKKIIRPGMTVVDIGAHIGFYTALYSKLVGPRGHVYAFEADVDNFALLKKNMEGLANVTIVNKAISDTNGVISFYKIDSSTGCHSTVAPTLSSTKTTIPATTLDAFIKENKISNVDIIKIDIEGGEPAAFRGMREMLAKTRHLQIVSEFNPDALTMAGINPVDFLKDMRGLGFSIYPITNDRRLTPLTPETMSFKPHHKTGYTNLLLKK